MKKRREAKEREGIIDNEVDHLITQLEESERSCESSDDNEIGLELLNDEMDSI